MRPEDIKEKSIIIAPLDWGMGHATRCVSIIHQLIEGKNRVVYAGTKAQIHFIKKDFPDLVCECIDGYQVTLDSTRSTYLQMVAQFGKLRKIISKEQQMATDLAQKYQADIIISDNRYGFRSTLTKNIIITHQIEVPLPALKHFVNKKIRMQIEQFDICWVPDDPDAPVCGGMIKPSLKIPKIFIGFLNRFSSKQQEIKYDYLIIISGPEPERTNFQNRMLELVKKSKSSVCFVSPNQIKHQNCVVNPSTSELNELINISEQIVSRAGYTTIMEMMSLQKSAILIPTKGQFEQEYLAGIINTESIIFTELDDFVLDSNNP